MGWSSISICSHKGGEGGDEAGDVRGEVERLDDERIAVILQMAFLFRQATFMRWDQEVDTSAITAKKC
jgi:hypothetical protein